MPSLSGRHSGKRYWRSLDELADSPDFRAYLEAEFPHVVPMLAAAPNRRQFLKLMGASLALAGLTGCRWPRETIVPYAKRPQGRLPGVPVSFATAFERSGVATGLLVTSYDGRPIKVEGNDQHPDSRGATDALAQASLLELYDPDRSRMPAFRDNEGLVDSTWEAFYAAFGPVIERVRAARGAHLYVLAQADSSPTLRRLRQQLLQQCPQAQWFEYEPLSRDNERAGTRLAFGRPLRPVMDLRRADVIVSLDDDFLLTHPASVRYTRDFAARRTAGDGTMNRLYVIESTLSLTGSNADQRFAQRSGLLGRRLLQLAAALAGLGLKLPLELSAPGDEPQWVETIAKDLWEHRGRGVLTVGPRQPAEVHALAALLNAALGNAGHTVSYVDLPDPQRPTHLEAIRQFAQRVAADRDAVVVVLGGNPAYDGPADLELGKLLAARQSVHLSLFRDETSQVCKWHLPQAHYLESWGDACGFDGLASIVQPLIEPLYQGRSAIELLAWLCSGKPAGGYELVRRTWQGRAKGDFEAAWRKWLNDGLIAGTAWPAQPVAPAAADWQRIVAALQQSDEQEAGYELVFAADHKLYDGRYANNGWLQELPDPITKLTWDNAALISTIDADRMGLRRDDLVRIELAGRSLELPVCPVPGQAVGSITLPLGYGRRAGGQVLAGAGFDTYALRTTAGWHIAAGARVRVLKRSYRLATTQDHHAIASDVGDAETQVRAGELIREATLEEFKAHPEFARHVVHTPPLVQPFGEHEFEGKPRWAMAIDLARCTGCSACVVACQAENNVPVVGKDEVLMGREMQWIRVDRYFTGPLEQPDGIRVAHQPLTCQQCENAPCEQVCPASATMHDQEGLNVMVYNRCVGTRYCSNNCPYKVRRFNWFYNHHGPAHPRSNGPLDRTDLTAVEKLVFNPEVTVRSRGVMEKCSFCVQRINAVKIRARNEGRRIADGEIVPACAQVCPAEAIVFGDLNDEQSRVRRAHEDPRAYGILEFLNVRPRNVYLAGLTNPPGQPPPEPVREHHAAAGQTPAGGPGT